MSLSLIAALALGAGPGIRRRHRAAGAGTLAGPAVRYGRRRRSCERL